MALRSLGAGWLYRIVAPPVGTPSDAVPTRPPRAPETGESPSRWQPSSLGKGVWCRDHYPRPVRLPWGGTPDPSLNRGGRTLGLHENRGRDGGDADPTAPPPPTTTPLTLSPTRQCLRTVAVRPPLHRQTCLLCKTRGPRNSRKSLRLGHFTPDETAPGQPPPTRL